MNRKMIHRGPDGEGYFETAGFHLAMRRLSIVDLQTGDQPKYNRNKNVVVFLNGEIYNYIELRKELETLGYVFQSDHSDTEVIAHAYEEYGIAFIDKLIGMFAICLLDKAKAELFLIRDRFGKKPLYFTLDDESKGFNFASEFNVLRLEGLTGHMDLSSLAWYFSQKAMPGTGSIDTRIKKLPAGSYLRLVGPRKYEIVQYHKLGSTRASVASTEEKIRKDVETLIHRSVQLRMRADVEVGAFLSGGLDSSFLVALASKQTSHPLKTYCLVYDQPVNRKADDRKFAVQIAKRYRTDHTEVLLTPELLSRELPAIVKQYGQPNSAVISNWFISREMKKKIKVALSGDGADELFGSYFLHRMAAHMESKSHYPNRCMRPDEKAFVSKNAGLPLYRWIDHFSVFSDNELRSLFASGRFKGGSVLKILKQRTDELKTKGPLNRMLEFDCRNLLVDQILNYSDVLGMAHSVEIRTPYLDNRLAEYLFSLNASYKIRKGITKYLLKKIAEDYLPKDLIYRPKEGFVEPAVYWIHKELKEFCLSYLRSKQFNRLKLLNPESVNGIVDSFYRKFDFYTGKKVWSLLMFSIWERQCRD